MVSAGWTALPRQRGKTVAGIVDEHRRPSEVIAQWLGVRVHAHVEFPSAIHRYVRPRLDNDADAFGIAAAGFERWGSGFCRSQVREGGECDNGEQDGKKPEAPSCTYLPQMNSGGDHLGYDVAKAGGVECQAEPEQFDLILGDHRDDPRRADDRQNVGEIVRAAGDH